MPRQETQSGLLARLGDRFAKAFEQHKGDDTEFGQIELPAGIEGGIALLTSCGFGVYKNGDMTGELFFRASGTVIKPKKFTDDKGSTHRTEGQHTSIGPEPICDTPKRQSRPTLDLHVSWVLNELRKLGVNTKDLEWDSLEDVCKALIDPKNPTYFKFRTWKGAPTEEYPNPRTNNQWIGPAEAADLAEEEQDDDVKEAPTGTLPAPKTKTAPSPTPTPQRNGTPPKPPTGPVQKTPTPQIGSKPKVTPTKQPKPPQVPEHVENEDIDSLAARAAEDDDAAKGMLTEQAMAAGFTQEQVDACPDWPTLAEAMKSGEDAASFTWGEEENTEAPADEEPAADEQEEWEPKVEELYLYHPVTNGKKSAKPVEVEVLSVNAKKKTVDVKNNANPRIKYTALWTELVLNNE